MKVARAGRPLSLNLAKPQQVRTVPRADRFVPAQAVKAIAPTPDTKFDGLLVGANGTTYRAATPLSQVTGALPKRGVRNSETIIEVNGVGERLDHQAKYLQLVANATGSRVIGVHNATGGGAADVAQAVLEKLHLTKDPAVQTLTRIIARELRAGRDVHLVAHSQGALEVSLALEQVRAGLVKKLGRAKAEALLNEHVKVETFAGAATRYPDGPQYRHYLNAKDAVPQLFGLGVSGALHLSHPGRGAKVVTFDDPSPNAHELGMYLHHRLPW